ncbi:MAG: hypothetical protein NVS3B7_07580 [Candidatus Elarobacter sp.]
MTKLGSGLPLFVRLTAGVAVAVVALVVLLFVLKIVIFAAIVAALVVGALALWKLVRRRRGGPLVTYSARR